MVRQKTRWLLVRVQLEDGHEKSDHGSVAEVTKKELARAIKDSIEQCFGSAATGPALDTQGSVVLCSRVGSAAFFNLTEILLQSAFAIVPRDWL
jgi:hypothetical protein